jgi:hypothetical protein
MNTRANMNNAIRMSMLLEFEAVFPDEKPQTIEDYLKGGNKNIILNVAAFFLGFKPHNSKFDDTKILLSTIFNSENQVFANGIYAKIKAIETTRPEKVKIINTYSSLSLFEAFFSKVEEQETQTQTEFERNIFKAYLILNSKFTRTQLTAFSSTQNLDKELKIPMIFFCIHYPIADKENYDIGQIWITQLVKAIYLLQFLGTHEKTKPLFAAFLRYFNCFTWQEYLMDVLPLINPQNQNHKEAHTDISVTPGEKFDRGCAFIEKFIVHDNDTLDENDFLTLRSKPFYKISDGVYRIIFNLFVVEKIFKGIYFQLRDLNKSLPKKEKIDDLKSFYGKRFSEETLSVNVIKSIYPDKCICFSGKELEGMKIDGAPDYYIRKGTNILLFESKDFLIRADKKGSFDFNIYKEEFQRVLYYQDLPDGKIKFKAVMQLINSVRKMLKNEFEADKNYHYKDVIIYPILLTHDLQYDTPGLQDLLNYWFLDELEGLKEEGLFIHHVKPIILINIDSLIYHQLGLLEDIPLHEVLKLYLDHIRLYPRTNFKSVEEYKEYRMSKMIPFSTFIEKLFIKKGIRKVPSILDSALPSIFNV